ncbi:hypothetical protein G6F45_014033 [Rhizopus arrhizus]|nr:hypothetical protein G6F45_014033 [Rhizopus arrhizus]
MQDAVGQFLDTHVVDPSARRVVFARPAKARPFLRLHARWPVEGGFAFLGLPHVHRRQRAQPFNDPDACALQAPGARHLTVKHGFGNRPFGFDHHTQLFGHLAVVGAAVERL